MKTRFWFGHLSQVCRAGMFGIGASPLVLARTASRRTPSPVNPAFHRANTPSPEKQLEMVTLAVPIGVQAGQEMQFKTQDGRVFGVVVPNGVVPGGSFSLKVPVADKSWSPPPPKRRVSVGEKLGWGGSKSAEQQLEREQETAALLARQATLQDMRKSLSIDKEAAEALREEALRVRAEAEREREQAQADLVCGAIRTRAALTTERLSRRDRHSCARLLIWQEDAQGMAVSPPTAWRIFERHSR